MKLLARQVYDSIITSKVLDLFTGLAKKSISTYINELISDRLKLALKTNEETPSTPQEAEVTEENKIETTLEELEGFGAVKAILRGKIDSSRIGYKDTLNYFNILLDNSVHKTFCRLYFNGKKKFIAIYGEEIHDFVKYPIEKLDDIYNYSEQILAAAEVLEHKLLKAVRKVKMVKRVVNDEDNDPQQL